MKSKIGTTILLVFVFLQVQAQVVIPFAYFKGLYPLVFPVSPFYVPAGNIGDIINVTGGMGTYMWSNTLAAQTDGSTVLSGSDPTSFSAPFANYDARITSYSIDTVTVTSPSGSVNLRVVTYSPLTISPTTVTIGISATQTFTGVGGCLNGTDCVGGARVFSVVSGGGSINASTGVFAAPVSPGTTVVQVVDSIGNAATAIITVSNTLTISPPSLKIAVASTNIFTAILGTSPYVFSVLSGTGSIDVNSGLYTAPALMGSAVVRVRDAGSNTSDSPVLIIEPIDVKVGQYFACALHNEGSVKCWGQNSTGQLGIGSTGSIGDVTTEVGGANAFANMGTGRTATKIALGLSHACALLDNATVKCWGANGSGQLGKGNTTVLGDNANEMSDALTAIDLGAGRTAIDVYAFGNNSCAKLDNLSVKCWGSNSVGQLGLGDIINRGSAANQMGDNLLPINLGTGRTATKLVGGTDFACALLDNGSVKCWGQNSRGQSGKDNTVVLGNAPGEMGDALLAINIDGSSGSAKTALDIVSGPDASCIKRNDSSVICWGRNNFGQVGKGNSGGGNAAIGDAAGEMAAIVPIIFGAGFGTVSTIYVIGRSTCAMDTADVVRCWGRNSEGQLLIGSTATQLSPSTTNLDFGTGAVLSKMFSNFYTSCALFTNKKIKCWGRATNSAATAASGVFLNGASTSALGDNGTELGNNLPYVNH